MQLYLVSPYMTNGTLTDWRKRNKEPQIPEIHRLVGFRRLSEKSNGIMHTLLDARGGQRRSVYSFRRNCAWRLERSTCFDVKFRQVVHSFVFQENILLDSNLRCQIADFGLTRHSDATVTRSAAFSIHHAAPELFGKCTCSRAECEGCQGDSDTQRKKTIPTDVYAFGSLFYAVRTSTYESVHLIATRTDTFRCCTFSREKRLSDLSDRHRREASSSFGQSKDGR